MSKNDIWQFSSTDANNTDIEGIDINTGWAPNQVGPAFRALMGRLARVCNGLAPWLSAIIDGAAGTSRALYLSTSFTTAGTAGYRWFIGADGAAETGSNAGSDFIIANYSDTGVSLSDAVVITRATGTVAVAGTLDVGAGVGIGGTLNVTGQSNLTGVLNTSNFVSNGDGQNQFQFKNNTGLFLTQLSGNPAAGLIISLSNTGSIFAGFEVSGVQIGSITFVGSTTLYNTTSDYRLKVTFGDFTGDEILRIPVYKGAFKTAPDRIMPLMLAHEIQAVAPEAVTGEKDGAAMQQVDYSKLVPRMLAAMQGMHKRICELENSAPGRES